MTTIRSGITTESTVDRMAGCLAGQFCGDAYGAQFEFRSTKQILDLVGPEYRTMGGSYTWSTAPGQITDDSEMAVALIDSIIEQNMYISEVARKHYVKWYKSNPFDIGGTTMRALEDCATPDRTSQANGAMMRVSPLAVYHARRLMMADEFTLKELDGDAIMDAYLTHPHPTCVEANVLYARALVLAIMGYEKKSIMEHLEKAAYYTTNPSCVSRNLGQIIPIAPKVKPEDIPSKSGWVLLAFHNAIYRLMNCDSPEQAIRETAYMGGDTDTNCAIAGALVGAYYGFDAFPKDWVFAVENCNTKKGRYPREYYQDAVSDIQGIVYKLSAAAESASMYDLSITTDAEDIAQ